MIKNTLQEYIKTANNVVSDYVVGGNTIKHTSKTVSADLPSALKNQVIQDAKSIFKKYTKNLKANAKKEPDKQKEIKVPILKKPVAIWNNQNYSIKLGTIAFPVWLNGKSTRIMVKTETTGYQVNRFINKLGTLRITEKSGKCMAQIAVNAVPVQTTGTDTMGMTWDLKYLLWLSPKKVKQSSVVTVVKTNTRNANIDLFVKS